MTTIRVLGMSCGHCVAAVKKALERVEGITDVEVDLDSGTTTFNEVRPVDMAAARQAVADAGYEVE